VKNRRTGSYWGGGLYITVETGVFERPSIGKFVDLLGRCFIGRREISESLQKSKSKGLRPLITACSYFTDTEGGGGVNWVELGKAGEKKIQRLLSEVQCRGVVGVGYRPR